MEKLKSRHDYWFFHKIRRFVQCLREKHPVVSCHACILMDKLFLLHVPRTHVRMGIVPLDLNKSKIYLQTNDKLLDTRGIQHEFLPLILILLKVHPGVFPHSWMLTTTLIRTFSNTVHFLFQEDMVCLSCTATGERVCLAAEGFGNRHCFLENIADKVCI